MSSFLSEEERRKCSVSDDTGKTRYRFLADSFSTLFGRRSTKQTRSDHQSISVDDSNIIGFKKRKPSFIKSSTIGRTTEIKRSNSTTAPDPSVSTLSDKEVRILYNQRLNDLVEREDLKQHLKSKSITHMRQFLTMYDKRQRQEQEIDRFLNVTTSHSPHEIVVALVKGEDVLESLMIKCRSSGLSWIMRFRHEDFKSLLAFFHKSTIHTSKLRLAINILYSIVNTGWGFNTFIDSVDLSTDLAHLLVDALDVETDSRTLKTTLSLICVLLNT
ncbi:hypothetical protein ACOME3_005979 [Neoechinorhynchus agilis]